MKKDLYACIAKDSSGGRCRRWAEMTEVEGKVIPLCKDCVARTNLEITTSPNRVLLQFFGGKGMRKDLQSSGIHKITRNEKEIEAEHLRHAQDLGRDPYYYGDRPVSGTLVFGKDGVVDVGSLQELIEELLASGYEPEPTHFHWYREERGKGSACASMGATLVLSFVKGGPDEEFLFEPAVEKILKDSWGAVRVCANPPQSDGEVLHSVSFYRRQAGRRGKFALRFLNGLWALDVATEAAVEVAESEVTAASTEPAQEELPSAAD